MTMMNPTLWRTCRVLSHPGRIRLLRLVLSHPDAGVSELAELAGISQPSATQELRRLQSRGLLKRIPVGRRVTFLPIPDPQVPTAEPLLQALETALNAGAEQEEIIARLARGLAHEK